MRRICINLFIFWFCRVPSSGGERGGAYPKRFPSKIKSVFTYKKGASPQKGGVFLQKWCFPSKKRAAPKDFDKLRAYRALLTFIVYSVPSTLNVLDWTLFCHSPQLSSLAHVSVLGVFCDIFVCFLSQLLVPYLKIPSAVY